MSKITFAMYYAEAAHKAIGHKRKYCASCYTVHTKEVASLVRYYYGFDNSDITIDMICAAHLHDVVEDTQVEIDDIENAFGFQVANLVYWLTDTETHEDGNRAYRKKMSRERLAKAPAEAQTIKCCDLISNTTSIVKDDPSFAKVYLKEKQELLEVITKAEPKAYNYAKALAYAYPELTN